jgi:Protein of unknown function (DUF1700)
MMANPDQKIETYLKRVRTGLRGLPQEEVTDILNELRTHIQERLELAEGPPDTAVDTVLQSFGRAEKIAALYVSESLVLRAESSRTPWTILKSLFYWSTLSVVGFCVFIVCLFGYSFGICFFLAAILKPFHPQGVGLWYEDSPHQSLSLHVGGVLGPPVHERELLGWWLVPIGCSLGGGTILLTTQFALWSLRRLRRSKP